MRSIIWIRILSGLSLLILWPSLGVALEQKLPVIDGKETIALVNDEPITLKEFNEMLGYMHEKMDDIRSVEKIDYSEPLKRLINGKLILYEAKNIGIDELPDIRESIENYSKDMLKKFLVFRNMKNVEPDASRVDAIYKERILEYKIISAYFSNEEYAIEMEKELEKGGKFEDVLKKYIDGGKADGGGEGEYIKAEKLLPHVLKVVSEMKSGLISPIIKVERGFTIIKLDGKRFTKNSATKEEARNEALKEKRKKLLDAYTINLKKKYVKIDGKILKSLNYEAKEPGFKNYSTDKRIVAKIKGGNSVSVADLTDALRKKYFHGIETAIKGKRINKEKSQVLEKIWKERVFIQEAKSLQIDKSEEYMEAMEKYQNNIVFNAFIRKVIDPEIYIDEAELRRYFREHSEEYTSPEMMRILNLVFSKRDSAEDAIEKLRAGADFKWVKENADHQINEKSEDNLLLFSGNLITTNGLPEEVRRSVERARTGEYRFYEDAEKRFHVLYLQEVIPPRPEMFENVKGSIVKKIVNEKRERSLEAWAEKLKAASDIKIFATDIDLERAVAR